MQAPFKDQLKAVVPALQIKTKEQPPKPSQPCLQANSGDSAYKQAASAFIWRITRSKDRFDRFDVVETCSNNMIWSALDLEEAQEVVELHNQQVEKWWEIKELAKKAQQQVNSFDSPNNFKN